MPIHCPFITDGVAANLVARLSLSLELMKDHREQIFRCAERVILSLGRIVLMPKRG
jgi:hypothetical protein